MSHTMPDCAHPDKRPTAGGCTPEQIHECHGDVQEHPCKCGPERIRECHGDVQEHPCDSA